VALKKPSELLDVAPQTIVLEEPTFNAKTNTLSETFEVFKKNLDNIRTFAEPSEKIEELNERVDFISKKLEDKLTKKDLENALVSQLLIFDENFKLIKDQVKQINKEDLKEFKDQAKSLAKNVAYFIEQEIPKYKKEILKNNISISEKYDTFSSSINETLTIFSEHLSNSIFDFEKKIEENKNEIESAQFDFKNLEESYSNLYSIIESRSEVEKKKINEYQDALNAFNKDFEVLSDKLNVYNEDTRTLLLSESDKLFLKLTEIEDNNEVTLQKYIDQVTDIQTELVESKVRANQVIKINEGIGDLKTQLESLITVNENHKNTFDELREEINNLGVGDIQINVRRLESKIEHIQKIQETFEPEVIIKDVITEGGFSGSPSQKTSDPLTPLDQKFVTLEQLQSHYRNFINRIQVQLSTIGGGGETQLKYLDDVVGIATNPTAYDNKFLKYDHSIKKFVFETVSSSGGSSESLWGKSGVGIVTTSNVGIGTTQPTSALTVSGSGLFSGIVTAAAFFGDGSGLTGIVAISTYSNSAGIATYASTAGIATVANYASTAGIATYATSSGIATYSGTAGIATYATSSGIATYAGTSGIATVANYASTAGIATYSGTAGIATVANYASTAGIATYAGTAGIATVSNYASTAGIATYSEISGITTYASIAGIATYSGAAGIATYAGTSGIATVANYSDTAGIATYATSSGIATYAGTSGVSTSVIGGVVQVSQIQVTGIATFTSGPVLIGTAASTGTPNQVLQVVGSEYISDNLGIGTTTPTSNIHVIGSGLFTGIVTAAAFFGDGSGLTGIGSGGSSSYAPTSGIATSVIGGIASVSSLSVSGVSTLGIVTATTYYGKVKEKVVTVTGNYTLDFTDSVVKTNGTLSLFLPQTVGTVGDKYYIKNVGIGTITIIPFGSETIDSYSSFQITDFNTSITIISDNTAWTIH
jgi:hypothetical protein